MKKFLLIFIAIYIISPEEFSKVPFFISHYFEHASTNGLNLSEFISLHYFNEYHENSNEDHHHLPLKHDHQCCSISQSMHYGPVQQPEIIKIMPNNFNYVPLNYTPYTFTLYHNIWNPPKRA